MRGLPVWYAIASMFLRRHSRKKNGKRHDYWSAVESRRCAGGRVQQRQVLYLGEISHRQEAAWQKTLRVFDEQQEDYRQLALFPAGGPARGRAVLNLRKSG